MSFSIVEGDVVIRDSSGNPVGVILDGTVYRFAVDAKITSSALPTGAATEATVATLLTEAEFQDRVQTVTQGTRTAQSIEYPALLAMTKQVLDELKAIRLHLEQINEETDPL